MSAALQEPAGRLAVAEELLERAKQALRGELQGFVETICILRPIDGHGGVGPIEPDLATVDVEDLALVDELADLVLDIEAYFAEPRCDDHWLDRVLAARAERRASA